MVIGWYAPQWWVGTDEEQEKVLAEFGCNAAQRESVLPYTLSPLQSEFITDFTTVVDSGIVSNNRHTHTINHCVTL